MTAPLTIMPAASLRCTATTPSSVWSYTGPRTKTIAHEIVAIGQEVGLPCAAVQPVYTLSPQDNVKLRLLAAIDRNCRLTDLQPDDPSIDRHWLSPH